MENNFFIVFNYVFTYILMLRNMIKSYFIYLIFMSQIMLDILHSTLAFSFSIDVASTHSILLLHWHLANHRLSQRRLGIQNMFGYYIYLQLVWRSGSSRFHMMTSSNGNIFCVTAPLCGELTGLRRFPLPNASDAELWRFLLSAPWMNGWTNSREAGDLRRNRAHYGVIVMII